MPWIIRSHWRKQMQANRLQHTAEGLATSLREFGQAHYPDLWPKLDQLHCPVLLITGGQDSNYCTLAKHMEMQLPNAKWASVPNSGHMPHLETPEQTAILIRSFSNSVFKSSKKRTA